MRSLLLTAALAGCGPYDDVRWCARHPEDCDDVDPPTTSDTETSVPPTETVDGCGGPPEAQAACLVITEHCYECHGQAGRAEGGFNFSLDVPRMVATAKVVPGDPPASRIYSRSAGETMPPVSVAERPSDDDIDAIEAWILAGAPDWDPDDDCAARAFVAPQDEVAWALADLQSLDGPTQLNTRYLTLAHLWNACVGDDELQTYRYGLSKLLNSLSYGPATLPRPIDPDQLVFAVDLRKIAWDQRNIHGVDAWEHVVKRLPFGLSRLGSGDLRDLTHSRFPIVPADWLVRQAARPPLYTEVLRLPDSGDAFLLDRFGIDRVADLGSAAVLRSGFESSGVSENNRMVERHEGPTDGSYCWVSYDFSTDVDAGNVLSHPLHPLDPLGSCAEGASHQFLHAGGELICSLPNGLQAYYLETSSGFPIDVGPIDIVQDFTGPEAPLVRNGVSCMYCHAQGILEKSDGVSDHWALNVDDPLFGPLFPSCVDDLVQARYRPAEALDAMAADRERFLTSLEAVGVPRDQLTEPVSILANAFDEDLTALRVAAEIGLDHRADATATPSAFRTCLSDLQGVDPLLALEWTPLLSNNTVSREVFLGVARDFLCACDAVQIDDFVCQPPSAIAALDGGAVGGPKYSDTSCGPAGIACLADQHCITFDDDRFDRVDDAGACVDD